MTESPIEWRCKLPDGMELAYDATWQEFWSDSRAVPDPAWAGYDINGHFHVAVAGPAGEVAYPTLEPVWHEGWCERCHDWHKAGEIILWFECTWCRAEVEPGTRIRPAEVVQWKTSEAWTLQGYREVDGSQDLAAMVASGEAERVVYRRGKAEAYIRKQLTREEARVYLEQVAAARDAEQERP